MNAVKAFGEVIFTSVYFLLVIALAAGCTLISAVRTLYKELRK